MSNCSQIICYVEDKYSPLERADSQRIGDSLRARKKTAKISPLAES